MKRREFIAVLSAAAATWPLAARAQQPAMTIIGYLNASTPDGYSDQLSALRQGLKESVLRRGRVTSRSIIAGPGISPIGCWCWPPTSFGDVSM